MLKKIAAVLIFAVFLFIALKFYNYMSRDGFNDAGPITGFMCPEGWEQNATDESNGTCTAPCFPPGNDSPQSFAYGPNSGGFPLNRRSGWDYCIDSNNNNQAAAFSVRSATVGGPPIVAPAPAPASALASFPDFDNFKVYGVNDIVKAEDKLYIMTVGIGAAGYHPAGYPQHWALYTPPAPASAPMPMPPMATPRLLYRITDNGYTATGQFATHFPSSTQIILDSREPTFDANGTVGIGSAKAALPEVGSLINGPFIQPGTTVVKVEETSVLPSNPYVGGTYVTISQPLVGIKEDRGDVFVYTFPLNIQAAPAPPMAPPMPPPMAPDGPL